MKVLTLHSACLLSQGFPRRVKSSWQHSFASCKKEKKTLLLNFSMSGNDWWICSGDVNQADNMHLCRKVILPERTGASPRCTQGVHCYIPQFFFLFTPSDVSMSALTVMSSGMKEKKGRSLQSSDVNAGPSSSRGISIEARQVHFQTQSPELSLSRRPPLVAPRSAPRLSLGITSKIIFKEMAAFHKDISPAELISPPRCNWGVT